MGVLDDAIREHLDLKRQHGVPEEELRRQEEEALGPARREVAPAESGGGEADAEAELHDQETMLQEPPSAAPSEASPAEPAPFDTEAEAPAPEPEAGGAVSELVAAEPELTAEHGADDLEADSSEADLAAEPDLADEPDAGARVAELDEDYASEPPAAEEPPSESGGDTLPSGFESVDDDELLDDDDDALEEDDADDADVLEDTPDFLQETPEHDRLWFEQKPPRDFDFD